ncbi:MAG: hypothetical protein GWP10_03565 [Nitrospiraceae bacterium]|nr:hypothetical protein [Nitrospiraceae bacterium]
MVEIGQLTQLDRPEILSVLLPHKGKEGSYIGSESETLKVISEDGTEIHSRVFLGRPGEPHILFFPAEYDTESSISELASGLGKFGISLISMDYRGCMGSAGEPSISALPQDAEAFYQVVKDWYTKAQRTGPLVFMGRSLGTAVALDLASRHVKDSLALILESAFDSTEGFLSGKGISFSGEDLFSPRAKMLKYHKAVLFIHSHRDQVVSINAIDCLLAESRSNATQLQIVPSGCREDIMEKAGDIYFSVIRDFLNRRMGRRPHRRKKHNYA